MYITIASYKKQKDASDNTENQSCEINIEAFCFFRIGIEQKEQNQQSD